MEMSQQGCLEMCCWRESTAGWKTSRHVCLRHLSRDQSTATHTAKPEAATIACYCFATNPPAAVFILLHSDISIFVNITGAQLWALRPPGLLASLVALKGDLSWENGMFFGESRCVLLWEKTIEKSLIKTAVVNIWKLFTITENHFIPHLIWWFHNSSQDMLLRWCYLSPL